MRLKYQINLTKFD